MVNGHAVRSCRKFVRQAKAGAKLPVPARQFALKFALTWRPAIEDKPPMPKKPGTNPKGEFAFFNVVYEDGSQRSNRRVPSELLGGLEGDEPARGFIIEQDREIAEKSRPPAAGDQDDRAGRGEEEVGRRRTEEAGPGHTHTVVLAKARAHTAKSFRDARWQTLCRTTHPVVMGPGSRSLRSLVQDDIGFDVEQTRSRIPAARYARVLHRAHPRKSEGAGNAGCSNAPAALRANW